MRCPKCHYLSFEPESRCRNCGYDFSLAGDLPMKVSDAPAAALDDIDLHGSGRSGNDAGPITLGPMRLTPLETQSSDAAAVAVAERVGLGPRRKDPRRPAVVPVPTSELPLFVRGLKNAPPDTGEHDETMPAVPIAPAPLSVRRSTPDPAQLRQKYKATEPASPDLFQALERADRAAAPASDADVPAIPTGAGDTLSVSAAERLTAACVDGILLLGIDVAIVWFTLRLCGLRLGELGILPAIPLAAFFLLVNVGYLILFTAASGQTVGKMAAGIRVVATSADPDAEPRPSFPQAALRSLLTFPSLFVFGAGFVPILLGEGRALHDRVAHTRVVRA